ncbi:MAG: bifunctional nuclease family protein [Bacteroidales bacterium]|nr:bifunctional nuclease family protein [Bacteroidales bacterium]
MNKIRLKVLGLSYSQTQTGAYALILEAEGTDHRIPIIIGSFEAQSIALQLENLTPPRPLTHDLFTNFSNKFGIGLREVLIHKLEEGVFHSRLIFQREDQRVEIDARTSDGVALALRFDCPIFTTSEIIDKAGIIIQLETEDGDEENPPENQASETQSEDVTKETGDLSNKNNDELKVMLEKAINQEAYELAARINKEMKSRKK